MSVVYLDESERDLNSYQNVLPEPVTKERQSTKTPLSTFKPVTQPNPINERATPLVRHEHSLFAPYSQDITVGQSKESNNCQKAHLHWISTTPKIAMKPPTTTNKFSQKHRHLPSPSFPIINSTLMSKFQPQELGGKNFINTADSLLRSEDIFDSMPSTSYHEHTSNKPTQMLTPKRGQQFSAVRKDKNFIDKKNRLEGITKNIATQQYQPNSMIQFGIVDSSTHAKPGQCAQHHLQQAQITGPFVNDDRRGIGENCISLSDPHSRGMMNVPAAQNLSKSAHDYNTFLKGLEDAKQQFTRLQDMLRRSTMNSTHNQNTYHQNSVMSEGFVIQNQLDPINQRVQFFPQNVNQYVPINSAYLQEVKSHELMKRYTDGTYVIYKPIDPKEVNIQFPTHHLSNQSYQNAEHPQEKQDHQNYRDLRQRSCLIQQSATQERVNQSFIKSDNTNLAASSEIPTVALSTGNTEFQTTSSSNQEQVTQFTVDQNKHVCQCLGMKKIMIDQATQMDSIIDVSDFVRAIPGSPLPESKKRRTVESVCQTEEWLDKEEDSLYQKKTDSECAIDNAIESENEVVPEINQMTLTAEENLPQENQREQSRIIVDQNTLDVIGTFLTQMGSSLCHVRDMFDFLRNSIVVSAQTYKILLEKFDKLNAKEPPQISASPSNMRAQVTQERPADDNDNTTSVDNATTATREQKSTFSLPSDYDPNDTRWTLKYQEKKQGLVEPMPHTDVYMREQVTQERPADDNDNTTNVYNATTPTREQKRTFSLPSDYDPNDTRRTLKYQEKKQGLVEPMPHTDVYMREQVTQERPADDNDNTTSVDNATTPIREQKSTFFLPSDYDPNDTRWTLKYREKNRGLVKLMPRTDVYVKKKGLKRCLQKSKDHRTLARLLLTEVFRYSALSVCSWTGGEAKAYNSINIDVRPGLDENARMVLLKYVEQHGKKEGWSMTETSAIRSTIETKIQEIRAKHEKALKA